MAIAHTSEQYSHELSLTSSTTKQRITWITVTCLVFLASMSFSLQGPFYPAEAELKGVQPSQYGFVFGVFQLVILITAPLYGKYVKVIGVAFLFKAGLFVCSSCTILFGFLDVSPPKGTFFGLSIAIRIVAALGESAVYTSSYVIIIRAFADSMGTGLAVVEMSFGLGSILGPTVGGALYEVGGFRLPFVLIGAILIFGCIVAMLLIPEMADGGISSITPPPTILSIFRLPSILIYAFSIFSSSLTIGFFAALLEPHLRSLSISPLQVGLVFMSNGAVYAVSSAICGKTADKFDNALTLIVCGTFLQIIGLMIVGPVPFIPIEKSVVMIVVGVMACGLGMGAVLVCSVLLIIKEFVYNGYRKDMTLQGFVSGLYNFTFAAGCFVGPTMGGIIYDLTDFRYTDLVVWGFHILAFFLLLVKMIHQHKKPRVKTRLVSNPTNGRNKLRSPSVVIYDNSTSCSDTIRTIA